MKIFTPFKNRWLKELATKDYSKPYIIDKITTPEIPALIKKELGEIFQ